MEGPSAIELVRSTDLIVVSPAFVITQMRTFPVDNQSPPAVCCRVRSKRPRPQASQQTGSLSKKPAIFPSVVFISGESSSSKGGTSTGSPQLSPLGNRRIQGAELVSRLTLCKHPSRSSRIPENCEPPVTSTAPTNRSGRPVGTAGQAVQAVATRNTAIMTGYLKIEQSRCQ
jgi:hypothetical protein